MRSFFLSLIFLFTYSLNAQDGFSTKMTLAEYLFSSLKNADEIKSYLIERDYQVETDSNIHAVYHDQKLLMDVHFDQHKHLKKVMIYFNTLDRIIESFFVSNYKSCANDKTCWEKKVPALRVLVDLKEKTFEMFRIGSNF